MEETVNVSPEAGAPMVIETGGTESAFRKESAEQGTVMRVMAHVPLKALARTVTTMVEMVPACRGEPAPKGTT